MLCAMPITPTTTAGKPALTCISVHVGLTCLGSIDLHDTSANVHG